MQYTYTKLSKSNDKEIETMISLFHDFTRNRVRELGDESLYFSEYKNMLDDLLNQTNSVLVSLTIEKELSGFCVLLEYDDHVSIHFVEGKDYNHKGIFIKNILKNLKNKYPGKSFYGLVWKNEPLEQMLINLGCKKCEIENSYTEFDRYEKFKDLQKVQALTY